MSVLDAIDTTVTLEWEQTRTIATLTQLSGRLATVNALRVPETGTECFLRLEGDGPHDTIAIDGVCVAVRDSEWGESEIDVSLIRVGTTNSATALRDFIEQHQIQKGGTVAVGKNRDNPEVKRFVYTLAGTVYEALAGHRADTPRTDTRRSALPVHDTVESNPHMAPNVAPSLGGGAMSDARYVPRGPTPTPIARLDVGEVDDELQQMLDMLDQRGPVRSDDPQNAKRPGGVDSADMQILAGILNDTGPAQSPAEPEDAILVETVAPGDNQPRPIIPPEPPKRGLVDRLLGRNKPTAPTTLEPHVGSVPQPQFAADQNSPSDYDPTSVWDQPLRQNQPGRGMVSGSLLAVQQLFAVDQAVRVDRAISYDSGKKKKLPGVAMRLSESKIRVRATAMPALYERIVVHLPAPQGSKEAVSIRCEVVRIRMPDVEGGEQSFDAKLTGSNEPQTMARLRQLMTEMQPILGEGP